MVAQFTAAPRRWSPFKHPILQSGDFIYRKRHLQKDSLPLHWKDPYQLLLTNTGATTLQGLDTWIQLVLCKGSTKPQLDSHKLVTWKERCPGIETNDNWRRQRSQHGLARFCCFWLCYPTTHSWKHSALLFSTSLCLVQKAETSLNVGSVETPICLWCWRAPGLTYNCFLFSCPCPCSDLPASLWRLPIELGCYDQVFPCFFQSFPSRNRTSSAECLHFCQPYFPHSHISFSLPEYNLDPWPTGKTNRSVLLCEVFRKGPFRKG